MPASSRLFTMSKSRWFQRQLSSNQHQGWAQPDGVREWRLMMFGGTSAFNGLGTAGAEDVIALGNAPLGATLLQYEFNGSGYPVGYGFLIPGRLMIETESTNVVRAHADPIIVQNLGQGTGNGQTITDLILVQTTVPFGTAQPGLAWPWVHWDLNTTYTPNGGSFALTFNANGVWDVL